MENIWQIVDAIVDDYRTFVQHEPFPELKWEITNESQTSEGYEAACLPRTIHIKAPNPLSLAYAISRLKIAAKSKHYNDFLGKCTPRFKLRPLWLECEVYFKVTDHFGVMLPKSCASLLEDPSNLKHLSMRMISLGYNALIFGAREIFAIQNEDSLPGSSLKMLFDLIRSVGLKIIVKAKFTKNLQTNIQGEFENFLKSLPPFDFLFYEAESLLSSLCKPHEQREMTSLDQALYEVEFLENLLSDQAGLLYFVSAHDLENAKQQSVWIPLLCDSVGNQTIIAFPAVAGDVLGDYLPSHPLWNELRQSPEASATALMPILNAGGIKQGEGLWPVLTYDLIDRYSPRCYGHQFAGIISLAKQLPKQGSLLDCSLWISAQAGWCEIPSSLLVETWFQAFKCDLNYIEMGDFWKKNREISLELSRMNSLISQENKNSVSHDECRFFAESILARLNYLEQSLKKNHKKSLAYPSILADQCTYFIRDGRRIVLLFLQSFNAPLGNIPKEDGQASFWTHLQEGTGQGLKNGLKIHFLDKPNSGAQGSTMHSIYQENRTFL